MKKTVCFFILIILIVSIIPNAVFASAEASAESISDVIQKAAPTAFGYTDNTEYYMQYHFTSLSFVDDCCVVVCTESTNFNEFGVFHVKSASDAKLCEKQLKRYLKDAKERFQSGVVYDIKEYPKFENAKVTVIGQYVIYTILDSAQSKDAIRAVKQILQ